MNAFAHPSGCSNGPTEAMNLLIKKVKRLGHGFRNSPTTACAYCCTVASGGRLTGPHDYEGAIHALWSRAPLPRWGLCT